MLFIINLETGDDMKKLYPYGLAVLTIFVLWILANALVGSALLLPGPGAVFLRLGEMLLEADTWHNIGMTFVRLIGSLALALITGFGVGWLAGLYPNFRRFVTPGVTIFRTIPVVSVIVIILILFGFRIAPFIISFLMIFPIMYQATVEGMTRLDEELAGVFFLEANGKWKKLWYCDLPQMMGYIRTGVLSSAGLGIKVLVMGEYLAQTPNSIGNALYLDKIALSYDGVFAWSILLVVIALLLESLIEQAKRRFNDRPIASHKREITD